MERVNYNAEEIKNLLRGITKTFRHYVLSQINHRGYSYTVPQLMVMHELYGHPGITLKELSALMGLAKSTVCGIVNRLEAQGAVVRTRDMADRRVVRIKLAPQMAGLNDSIDIIKKNYLASMLKTIEPAEVEKIIYGLKALHRLSEQFNKGD